MRAHTSAGGAEGSEFLITVGVLPSCSEDCSRGAIGRAAVVEDGAKSLLTGVVSVAAEGGWTLAADKRDSETDWSRVTSVEALGS
jgi:hypothetical protein